MTSPAPRHAIVLFAHGSRDPLWHKPMEAVAARIRSPMPPIISVLPKVKSNKFFLRVHLVHIYPPHQL